MEPGRMMLLIGIAVTIACIAACDKLKNDDALCTVKFVLLPILVLKEGIQERLHSHDDDDAGLS